MVSCRSARLVGQRAPAVVGSSARAGRSSTVDQSYGSSPGERGEIAECETRTALFRVTANCDPVGVASQEPSSRGASFARGTTEFDRALGFFDATYAVALTLLVTTLDGYDMPGTWTHPAALWAVMGTQVVAFFIAFAVVAFYWRSNHAFVGRLNHLSGRLLTVNIMLLAFIVLLPFSTDAMGQFQEPLATAVFAGNVAVISSMEAVMSVLAWREGLLSAPPSRQRMRLNLVLQLIPAAVFLASIPVAYLVSSSAARLSWLSLLILNPLVGVLVSRRATQP
jgi:uncharacterized membrane protein